MAANGCVGAELHLLLSAGRESLDLSVEHNGGTAFADETKVEFSKILDNLSDQQSLL